jgi:hypothetical protein
MKTKHSRAFLALLFGGLLLSTPVLRAQGWSSVASVCEPGVNSIGLYDLNAGTFQFLGGDTGQIKARCAVTNPLDSGVPKWKTLTVGYVDPDGTGTDYQVDAQLYRVAKSTGNYGLIATFDSSAFSATGATSNKVTFSHTFDFTNYAYWINLTVDRGDANQNPGVWFVSLQ